MKISTLIAQLRELPQDYDVGINVSDDRGEGETKVYVAGKDTIKVDAGSPDGEINNPIWIIGIIKED